MGNILMKHITFLNTHQSGNYFLPNGLNEALVQNYKEQAELLNLNLEDYFKSSHCDPHAVSELAVKHNKFFNLHYVRDLYTNVLPNFTKITDFNYRFKHETIVYDIQLKNIDNVDENEDNYYIINLFGNEDFLFSNVPPKTNGKEEIFDLVKDFNFDNRVIELLSKNKLKLVIATFHEGGGRYQSFLERIFYNVEKHNINPNNIFYINADAFINQNYLKYCERTENHINVYNSTYLLNHSAESFIRNEKNLLEKQNYFLNTTDVKEKNFVCLNRTADKSHKLWFLSELYKNDIFKDCYYSIINNRTEEYSYEKKHTDYYKWVSEERYINQLSNLNAIKELGSVVVKEEIEHSNFVEANFRNPFSNDNSFLYSQSYISIVNESTFLATQISEKVTKPLLYFQPFIVVGGPGYLKRLQELGFKTFSQWWDESYDDETEPIKRMDKIVKLITELNDKEKLHKIFLESKEIVINNSLLFRKLKTDTHIAELFNWIFTC